MKRPKINQAFLSSGREVRVARGDNLYQAVMRVCLPIADKILRRTSEREGVVVTSGDLAMYRMGFTDCAYCLAMGELELATLKSEADQRGTRETETTIPTVDAPQVDEQDKQNNDRVK